MKMGYCSNVSPIWLTSLIIISLLCFPSPIRVASLGVDIGGGGVSIGIGIGIGGDPSQQHPPPSSPCPPPSPVFESPRIEMAYFVIQALKAKICQDPSNDPQNITRTWVGPDVCHKYKGFRCAVVPSFKQKAVSDVQFNGFDLKAPLAGFIDKLLDVSIFHANSNRFHGVVPYNLGPDTLPYLFELDLSNNGFAGSFPTSILRATRLTFLDIRFNSFRGSVPPCAFSLDVDVLFINNNGFVHQLPPNLGHTRVLYLTFANNHLTGPIPASIGLANNTLLEVLFLNNRLSGCLPWEIGLLKRARIFDASKNMLSGPIPASFGCLRKMKILNLGSNFLDGPVPEVVCQLPRLTNLTLRDNYFTELGPACWKLLESRKLDVSRNCIPGLPNQRSPAECEWFFLKPKPAHCPDPYLHLPCKPCSYHGPMKRGTAAAAPLHSRTYAALHGR